MKNNKLFLFLMLVILISGCIVPTQLPVLTTTMSGPAVLGTLSVTPTPAPTPIGPGDTPPPTYTPPAAGRYSSSPLGDERPLPGLPEPGRGPG